MPVKAVCIEATMFGSNKLILIDISIIHFLGGTKKFVHPNDIIYYSKSLDINFHYNK